MSRSISLVLLGALVLVHVRASTLSTFQWTSPISGNFSSDNWNTGICCPGPADVAIIAAAGGPYTVYLTSSFNISSLQIGSVTNDAFATLNVFEATLQLSSTPEAAVLNYGSSLLMSSGSLLYVGNDNSSVVLQPGSELQLQGALSVLSATSAKLAVLVNSNATIRCDGQIYPDRAVPTISATGLHFLEGSNFECSNCDAAVTGMEHTAVNSSITFQESNVWFSGGAQLQFDRVQVVFRGSQDLSDNAYDSALSTDARLNGSFMKLTNSELRFLRNGWFELYDNSTLVSHSSNVTMDGTYSYFGVTDSTWTCGDASSRCGDISLKNGAYARIRRSTASLIGFNATIHSGSEFTVSAASVLFNGSFYVADAESYFTIRSGSNATIIQDVVTGPFGWFLCYDSSVYVGGSFITNGKFETANCSMVFDGPFTIPSGARIIIDRTDMVTTDAKYIGPTSIYNQDYGSFSLEGSLIVDSATWIINATRSVITGSLRTTNCLGAPRELIVGYTGNTWNIFNVSSGYTSCLVGIDETNLRVTSGSIQLAERTPFRTYNSDVVVNGSFIVGANSSIAVDYSVITFGVGASLELDYNVVLDCWFGSKLFISGGSVVARGDDRDPVPDFPGFTFHDGSSITITSGSIYMLRRTYLVFFDSSFNMRGGNIDANYGRVQLANSSGIIDQGSLVLRNDSFMWVYNGGRLTISGGDVLLTERSYLEIESSLVRVTGTVSLSNASSIVVFSNGILDVDNGTILTSADSFVRLENRGLGPGLLQGSGRIAGRVDNVGGKITFNNASSSATYLSVDQYNQGRNGTLEIKVGTLYGGGASTVINATGMISLGGSADINIDGDAAAKLRNGSSVLLLSGSSIDGRFDTVTITINNAVAPCQYRVQQQAKSLTLIFDPTSTCEAPAVAQSSTNVGLIVGVVFGVVIVLIIAAILAVILVPALRSRFMPAFAADRMLKMLKAKQAADKFNASKDVEMSEKH